MGNFANRENTRERQSVVASMITGTSQQEQTENESKEERETKKRINLVMLPSLYKDIKKIAYVERRSMSTIIAECVTKYVIENESKLKEYEKINRI